MAFYLQRESIGKKPKFPFGNRFLPLVNEEREAVETFLDKERVRQLVTSLDSRNDDASIRMLDAAYWVKGCSSLGFWRCAALVEVIGHGQRRGGYSLLDIKEAVATVATARESEPLPEHQGERVVRGAQALSPTLGARMLSGTVAGHAVFVRELMPQDLKLELEISVRVLHKLAGMLAQQAHERLGRLALPCLRIHALAAPVASRRVGRAGSFLARATVSVP